MNKIVKITILLVLLTLMLVSSCLVGFTEEKVISFARPEDLLTMDPYDAWRNVVFDFMIYNNLVRLNPNGLGFVPELATEWKISPDAKEYTFTLRKGVKFHNGEPFNAECVKVSLERYIHENLRSSGKWKTLKEVEVIDDYTAKVIFNEPNVVCLSNLAGGNSEMLPAKAFKEKGLALFDNPIGTGPFTWGHWKRGQEIVVNKSPDYWGEPVYADKFIYYPLLESSTRLAGVLTGDIDICDSMSVDQIPLVEKSTDVKIVKVLCWDQMYLGLKTDKPPFTDIKFRQAMDLAIDKEGIVKNILKGGRVTNGLIAQGILGFDDSLTPAKRDVEKAKQLVKESIYDGRTINMLVPIGWFPKEKEIAQVIQGGFKEAGINLELEILDGATYSEKRAAGNYDIYLNQDTQDGDASWFLTRVIGADTHKMGNINEELKMLIDKQTKEINIEKRAEILREIAKIGSTDFAPLIIICQYETIYFQNKGLEGVIYYGDKYPDFRYANYEK